VFSVGNSEKSANLRAWSPDMYATFIQFEHFHVSKSGASKKFVFTDCSILTDSAFYFAFPVLLCLMVNVPIRLHRGSNMYIAEAHKGSF
jgi:hypothetical protein